MASAYGADAPINIAKAIGGGSSLAAAVSDVTGQQYAEFRRLFVDWLKNWEDLDRSNVEAYAGALDSILDAVESISDRRYADLRSAASIEAHVQLKRTLAADAEILAAQLEELSPPAALLELHGEATDYLRSFVQWLRLELQYFETFDQDLIAQSNAMIPEVNTRQLLLRRDINMAKVVYNLK